MDGVQRSELGRRHGAGGVQDAIVDPDQVDAGEDVLAASDGFRSKRQQRPRDLGPGEGADDERPPAPQVAAQGPDSGSRTVSFTSAEESRQVALLALIASEACEHARRRFLARFWTSRPQPVIPGLAGRGSLPCRPVAVPMLACGRLSRR